VRRRLTRFALASLTAVAVASLTLGCTTDQDDPPGIDAPAVVDTSVGIDPAPDTTSPTTPVTDPTNTTDSPPTTDGLIDSIDGPVVVGSTP
jgi:hypothetical protein